MAIRHRLPLAACVVMLSGCGILAGLGSDYEAADDAAVAADVHIDAPHAADSATDSLQDAVKAADTGLAIDSGQPETSSPVDSGQPETGQAADSGPTPDSALCPTVPPATGTTIVTGADYPLSMASDINNVYWTSTDNGGGGGSVFVYGVGSGTVESEVSASAPFGIAASAIGVFFTQQGNAAGVYKCGPACANSVTQVSMTAHGQGIAVSPTGYVCWTTADGTVVSTAPGWTEVTGEANPYAIVADGTNVYWTDYSQGGSVAQRPLDGGAVVRVATGQAYPEGIAVDGAYVYWTNANDGTVNRAPIGSQGAVIVPLATNQSVPTAITFDPGMTYLYWTNRGVGSCDGSVMRCAASDCLTSTATISSGESQPAGITVTGSFVYWADYQGSLIRRAPR